MLEAELEADADTAGASMRALVGSGGKRLRPALVLLAGGLGNPDPERLGWAALALELTHAATLVHDDAIDRSPLRRGRPTIWATGGEAAAILVGDHYFAKAYELAARTGQARAVALLSRAVMGMCVAELDQQAARHDYRPTLEAYLRRIEGKTGLLLAAACQIGGLVGGLTDPQLSALARYGSRLGVAFQVADDVLDYTGDEAGLGKPVGHDLIEGSATLPLMLARADPEVAPALDRLLPQGRALDRAGVAEVVDLVRASGAPGRTLERARELAAAAAAELAGFPPGEAVDTLRGLAGYVVGRNL